MRDYVSDLQKLGLSDKEAKVYLASLELGPDTAQNISRRAGVNRATTYVAIKSLAALGLMSTFERDGKQYFAAGGPESVLDLHDRAAVKLAEKKALAERVAEDLRTVYRAPHKKAVVRYFEGKDGLMNMVRESLKETTQDTLHVVVPVDLAKKLLTDEEERKLQEFKVKKGIKTKVLYTKTGDAWPSTPDNVRKKVPENKFPLTCDIAIYPNKVRIATLGERVSGIVIHDKQFADTLRSIFSLAWEGAEKYQT